jgi:hypothetical protein
VNTPSQLLCFDGPVQWVPGPGAAGLTLLGNLVEADGSSTAAQLSLSGVAPLQTPTMAADVSVEALAAQELLLRSGGREWRVRCTTWQLHRDFGATFFKAVPPRPTPWTRRFGWRVLLGIAGTAPGRWLLSHRGPPGHS